MGRKSKWWNKAKSTKAETHERQRWGETSNIDKMRQKNIEKKKSHKTIFMSQVVLRSWIKLFFLLYMNEMRQTQAKRLPSVGRKTAFFFA